MTSTLLFIGNILLLVASGPAFLFAPLYHKLSHGLWRRSATGRALMLIGFCIQAIFLFAIVSSFVGRDWLGWEWLRVGTYGFLAVAMWRIITLLVGVNRDPERYAPDYDYGDEGLAREDR